MGAFLCVGLVFCQSLCSNFSRKGQRYNVLGAIDSHNQEFISMNQREYKLTLSVVELLEKIKATYPDHEIALVMDNAKYQRCNFVQEHAKKAWASNYFSCPHTVRISI